jgi:hypothetical protein
MHFDTVQANAIKLSRNHPLIQEKVNDYFLLKKISPSSVKGPPLYLTNQIAALGSIGELLSSTL